MNNKHALIVDDEEIICSLLTRGLKRLSEPEYTVVTAADGVDALKHLKQQSFDLVIVDYSLPGIHGLDLAWLIRKTTPETRIILISGHGEPDFHQNEPQIRLDGYLQKPFTLNQLFSMVNRIVD